MQFAYGVIVFTAMHLSCTNGSGPSRQMRSQPMCKREDNADLGRRAPWFGLFQMRLMRSLREPRDWATSGTITACRQSVRTSFTPYCDILNVSHCI